MINHRQCAGLSLRSVQDSRPWRDHRGCGLAARVSASGALMRAQERDWVQLPGTGPVCGGPAPTMVAGHLVTDGCRMATQHVDDGSLRRATLSQGLDLAPRTGGQGVLAWLSPRLCDRDCAFIWPVGKRPGLRKVNRSRCDFGASGWHGDIPQAEHRAGQDSGVTRAGSHRKSPGVATMPCPVL